jgi:hypothetical protein
MTVAKMQTVLVHNVAHPSTSTNVVLAPERSSVSTVAGTPSPAAAGLFRILLGCHVVFDLGGAVAGIKE